MRHSSSRDFVEPAYELEQILSAIALVEAGSHSALPALTLTIIRGAWLRQNSFRDERRIGVVTLAGRQPLLRREFIEMLTDV